MWILNKWIIPALIQMWKPVAIVFGVFLIYAKGIKDQKNKTEVKTLKETVKTMERIQDVEVNTSRDAALDRLRKHGNVRDN